MVMEQRDQDNAADAAEQMDADFALMFGEFTELLNELGTALTREPSDGSPATAGFLSRVSNA